jgi:hypothetical protein
MTKAHRYALPPVRATVPWQSSGNAADRLIYKSAIEISAPTPLKDAAKMDHTFRTETNAGKKNR